jgi:hypothetical protein
MAVTWFNVTVIYVTYNNAAATPQAILSWGIPEADDIDRGEVLPDSG